MKMQGPGGKGRGNVSGQMNQQGDGDGGDGDPYRTTSNHRQLNLANTGMALEADSSPELTHESPTWPYLDFIRWNPRQRTQLPCAQTSDLLKL